MDDSGVPEDGRRRSELEELRALDPSRIGGCLCHWDNGGRWRERREGGSRRFIGDGDGAGQISDNVMAYSSNLQVNEGKQESEGEEENENESDCDCDNKDEGGDDNEGDEEEDVEQDEDHAELATREGVEHGEIVYERSGIHHFVHGWPMLGRKVSTRPAHSDIPV